MIIKKNDVMPERSVILVVYGTPGAGKTSFACTSENPLLIDTDRGYDRACDRVDTITASKWEDIFNAENLQAFGEYKTIIIDTAKACLDDFLAAFVIDKNYKLATNSLKRFGEMADQFKNFVNVLRGMNVDIVFVCHDKETADGDIIRHAPDCTGQSKDLLVRIADEVGYICKQNGKRVITFEPTDTRVGKNVAGLETMPIPDFGTAEYSDFCAGIIRRVKDSIQAKGAAQIEALKHLDSAKKLLAECDSVEKANELMVVSNELAKAHQKAFKLQMIAELKEKGFDFDTTQKMFVEHKEKEDEKGDKKENAANEEKPKKKATKE